jgi:hypothetical protein
MLQIILLINAYGRIYAFIKPTGLGEYERDIRHLEQVQYTGKYKPKGGFSMTSGEGKKGQSKLGQGNHLLMTKFYIPGVRPDHVFGTRLIDLLNQIDTFM